METKYTIIAGIYTYGTCIFTVPKNEVRNKCEELKKHLQPNPQNAYIQIEVVNNTTGEIREYWNNKQNQNLF